MIRHFRHDHSNFLELHYPLCPSFLSFKASRTLYEGALTAISGKSDSYAEASSLAHLGHVK